MHIRIKKSYTSRVAPAPHLVVDLDAAGPDLPGPPCLTINTFGSRVESELTMVPCLTINAF